MGELVGNAKGCTSKPRAKAEKREVPVVLLEINIKIYNMMELVLGMMPCHYFLVCRRMRVKQFFI